MLYMITLPIVPHNLNGSLRAYGFPLTIPALTIVGTRLEARYNPLGLNAGIPRSR